MTTPANPTSTTQSDTVLTHTSAAHFQNEAQFILHVRDAIDETTSFRELVYTDVPLAWGKAVVEYLNENREGFGRKHYNSENKSFWIRLQPEIIHDCVQCWCNAQVRNWKSAELLTPQETGLFFIASGTTFEFNDGPYSGSRKEPDCYILVDNQPLPRLVIETGWSESHAQLLNDMNTWLVGGNGHVQAVILVKWSKVTGSRVTGIAEFYGLDTQGMPVMRQSELQIPRRVLFGPALVAGANPHTLLPLSIDDLRNLASFSLARMGLLPA